MQEYPARVIFHAAESYHRCYSERPDVPSCRRTSHRTKREQHLQGLNVRSICLLEYGERMYQAVDEQKVL
jgi:hypothetical protein